jgi:hypothetical protein
MTQAIEEPPPDSVLLHTYMIADFDTDAAISPTEKRISGGNASSINVPGTKILDGGAA